MSAAPVRREIALVPALCAFLVLGACSGLSDLIDGIDTGGNDPGTNTVAEKAPAAVTGLSASDGGALAVKLSWSLPNPPPDHCLAVLVEGGASWAPTDGTDYALGQVLGEGGKIRVAYRGSGSSLLSTGHTIGETTRFLVYAASKGNLYSAGLACSFVVPEPPPRFAGFDLGLKEGDFWVFDDYESSYGAYGSSSWYCHYYFSARLGASTLIAGKTAFPLVKEGSSSYLPRWAYLAQEGNSFFGSTDGATWETVFDGKTGIWKGGGFFKTWPATGFTTAGTTHVMNGSESVEVVALGARSGSSDTSYVYVPDYGYVSDGAPTMNWSEAEYFRPGYGPWGYTNAFSYLDSSYQSSTRSELTHLGSSFAGDAIELGVTSYPTAVQRLPTGGRLFGMASADGSPADTTTSMRIYYGETLNTLDEIYQDFYYFETPEAGTRTVRLERLVGVYLSSWPAFHGDIILLQDGQAPTLVGSTAARGSLTLPPDFLALLGGKGKRVASIDNAGSELRWALVGGQYAIDNDARIASFTAAAGGRYVVAIHVPAGSVRYKVSVE